MANYYWTLMKESKRDKNQNKRYSLVRKQEKSSSSYQHYYCVVFFHKQAQVTTYQEYLCVVSLIYSVHFSYYYCSFIIFKMIQYREMCRKVIDRIQPPPSSNRRIKTFVHSGMAAEPPLVEQDSCKRRKISSCE